jgi:hypothetical protein
MPEPRCQRTWLLLFDISMSGGGTDRCAKFRGGFARLSIGEAHLSEKVQVRRHDYTRAEVHGGRKVHLIGKTVGQNTHRNLTLAIRLLIN